jgi:S1-C subfamily serine protease
MQEAMLLHRSGDVASDSKAENSRKPLWIRSLKASWTHNGCIHCHDVKEILRKEAQANGTWKQSDLFRFPPTENVGLTLNVDRGNEVTVVQTQSSAAGAGLKKGDLIESLNGYRIRSIADAQFALDKSPLQGRVPISWRRGDVEMNGELTVAPGWRRSDISWRPSLQPYVGLPRLYGEDLESEERKQLGLTPTQLAFRHREKIHRQAQPAGVKAGDIILGFNDEHLDMGVYEFEIYVRRRYVAGDRVMINLIRDGKRLNLPMTILKLY